MCSYTNTSISSCSTRIISRTTICMRNNIIVFMIIGQVVSIALAKGQLSQTVTSRLASCKIIGKICASKKVDAYW